MTSVATRRVMFTAAIALALSACSTLGTPGSAPGPTPHGGTGQFRALTSAETSLGTTPPGITLNGGGLSIDDAMAVEGHLFYAAAEALPTPDGGVVDGGVDAGVDASVDAAMPADAAIPRDASTVDADVDAGPIAAPAIDWSTRAPRRIFHSTPGASWGFAAGTEAFTASEAWEGGYVTDPWIVRRADGRYLLYYAAAGGIGVASAASLEGPWTREGAGPALAATAEGTPRRPSAVSSVGLEGATAAILVYYELAGTIRLATSDDGITLRDQSALTIPALAARDDRDGVETSVGGPGAIVVPTPAGRRVLRLYYESRRSNGTVLVGMLGSAAGTSFEQYELPMFAERDRQRPAPRYVDQRTTLLYTWVPTTNGTGAEIASITPAGVQLSGAPTAF